MKDRTGWRRAIGAVALGLAGAWGGGLGASAETAPTRSVENVGALAKSIARVRYFHPSDGAYDTDWSAFAPAAVAKVREAASPEELRAALASLFAGIAPRASFFLAGEDPPTLGLVRAAEPSAPLMGVAAWLHKGLGIDKRDGSVFASARDAAMLTAGASLAKMPDPSAPFVADLGGGVWLSMPLAEHVDMKSRTVPLSRAYRPDGAPSASLGDRSLRLATVALLWGAVDQFWPHWEERGEIDWDEALTGALRAAETDTPRSFLGTLNAMLARLGDGQARAWIEGDVGERSLPVGWEWAGEALVIGAVAGGGTAAGALEGEARDEQARAIAAIRPGDTVTRIDGAPASEAISRHEGVVGAGTPGARRRAALDAMLRGPDGSVVALTIVRAGEPARQVRLRRTMRAGALAAWPAEKTREIRPGVYYVRPAGLSAEEMVATRMVGRTLEGMIFDLRGTAGVAPIIGAMREEPMTAPGEWRPVMRAPDQRGLEFEPMVFEIRPQAPAMRARLLFLIDARTVGQAERDALTVRKFALGTLVGAPTGGASGEPALVRLPGGIAAEFSGSMTRDYEGGPMMGAGVAPDIAVEASVAGLAAGKDEALEAAIKALGRE